MEKRNLLPLFSVFLVKDFSSFSESIWREVKEAMSHYKPKYAGHTTPRENSRPKKNEKKRSGFGTLGKAILLSFFLMTLCFSAFLLFLLPRLHSNQFSKNISLTSAYFLSQYREPSVPQTKESPDPFAGIYFWEDNPLSDQTEFSAENQAMLDWDILIQAVSSGDLSGNELFRICYECYGADEIPVLRDIIGLADEDFRFYLDDVPYLSQEGILPNGCEAVSATMLLQFSGFSISPEDFVRAYLPTEPVYLEWGCRYGPDPNQAYAGDPFSENGGWGCFAPVITEALNQCLKDPDQKAVNLTGLSLEQVFSEVVMKNNTPAAIWVTIDMQEISSMYQWQSYDHSTTYLYPANQHCMVLIGRDAEHYYLCDPYESNGVVRYPIEQVEQSYLAMGSQCVAILQEDLSITRVS